MTPSLWRSSGAVLLGLIVLQALSGFVLALHYAPSATTAWASIVFFEERIRGGMFIRGLHAWGASAVVLGVLLHFAVTAARRRFRAPHEKTWALGLLLGLLVLAFAHTGYLLPWDQKGYWSTKVATGIAGATPVVGGSLQRLALGGEDPGNLTLTRFYAVHVILLPFLLLGVLAAHLKLVRANLASEPGPAPAPYWPRQAFRDLLALLAAASVLAWLAWRPGPSLEAPADPASDFQPRPEWYFLPLYQLLKSYPGDLEFVGSEVIPGIILAALVALPWIDRRSPRLALAVAFGPLLVAVLLGAQAAMLDASHADLQRHRAAEAKDAALARELFKKNGGAPPEGPLVLLDRHPPRLGARVYKERCASCHTGRGQKGPDLEGYLSRRWLEEVIRDPAALFGKLDTMGKTDGKPAEIAALAVYVQSLESEERARALPVAQVEKGKLLFEMMDCGTCHEVKPGAPSDCAPNLAGYGSEDWLVRFVKNPKLFYGEHDKMPAFEKKLTEAEIRAVAVFLRSLQEP